MQLLSSIADLKDIVNKEYIDSILANYVLSANLGALATKDSLAFSDLTSRPSKLSDFTDDVVAGKYLPLSGGDVTSLTIGGNTASSEYKLDVVGKARVSDELIVTNPTGIRWAYGDYGTLFRNDGQNFYILFTDSGGALTGSWNSLRPFHISLTTGDVTMDHNLKVEATIKSSSVICATSRLRVNSPTHGAIFGFMDAQLFGTTTNVSSVHIGSCYGGSSALDNTTEYPNGVSLTAISIYRGRVGIGKRWSDTELRALHDANCSLGVLNNAHIMGNLAVSSLYSDNGQSGAAGVVLRNEGGIEITHASAPYIDFHHAASTTDFSMRLVTRSNKILSFSCSGGAFCPYTNGNESLGASSYRWNILWASGINVTGNTDVGGALTVGAGATFNGDARINGNLVVTGDTASGNSTLTIGTIVLTDENGTLKIAGNAYTTGQLGAGEAGQPTSGGTGGGGVLLLNTWPTDGGSYAGYALGGNLGIDLNTRVKTLEGKATAVSFSQTLTSGKQIGVLTIDGSSEVLYAPSNYSWSEITSRPSKLSDFTDDVVAGKYLPLSGGELKLTSSDAFKINRTNGSPYVSFWNDTNILGRIGFSRDTGQPVAAVLGVQKTLLHSGNYATEIGDYYLKTSGGTIDGNVTIGSSDTAGTSYKLRVDGTSRFTDRVSVTSLRIVPVNGSYAADFTIEGSSLTLNRELKFTNVTASDICSGIAAAFKTSLAQTENLIARNIILGASSGSASNLALNFQKYTSVSNTAPNGLTTLMTLTTDGNLGIGTASPEYKLDVVGKARISDELIVTYPTGFRWAYGDYGTLFRNDGQNFYILFTDSGGALTGSWNSLRPFRISLTTGDVAMEHNLTVGGQVKAGAEACANKRFVIFAPNEQAKGVSFGYMKATIANAYNIGIAHLGCNYGGASDITNTSVDYTAISMYRSVVGIGKEYDYASIRAIYDAKADLGVTKGVMIGSATLLWDSASSSLKMSNLLTAKGGINVTATDSANNSGQSGVAGVFLRNEGGIEISHASTPYIDFHYAKSTSDYDVRLICQSTNDLRISGHFYPMFSLNYELGAQSLRWSAIWAGGMNLSGNADISGVATVGSLKIGNIVLSDDNGTLKIAGNAYTTGQLATGEAGQAASGGGSAQYWSNEYDMDIGADVLVSSKEYIGTNTIVGWDLAGSCLNDLYIGYDGYTIWMQGSVDEASDMRLKTVIDAVNLDIRDIAFAPIFNYVFKSRPQGRQMLGSSAQYWQAIAPKAVSENDKGNLAMNYGAIALASVVAVAKKTLTHEEEIAELKSKVQSLETRLAKYELN